MILLIFSCDESPSATNDILGILESETFSMTPIEYSEEEYKTIEFLQHELTAHFRKFQINYNTNKSHFYLWVEIENEGEKKK